MAATINPKIVQERGHIVPKDYPLIIDKKIESLKTTKGVKDILVKCGLEKELERASKKSIRAGKGKTRGRKYKKINGPLIIVSKPCQLMKSAQNIGGIDVEQVKNINVKLLAPGAKPGRLTIWSNEALKIIEKEKLFI